MKNFLYLYTIYDYDDMTHLLYEIIIMWVGKKSQKNLTFQSNFVTKVKWNMCILQSNI